VDWYAYKPTRWVIMDVGSADPEVMTRAWAELGRRRTSGGLSEGDEGRVTEAALLAQGKTAMRDEVESAGIADYLVRRCEENQLTKEQEGRFFRQALAMELKVRPVVVAGEDVTVWAEGVGCGSNAPGWWNRVQFGKVWIGAREYRAGFIWGDRGLRRRGSSGETVPVEVEKGPQVVTYVATVEVYHGKAYDKESSELRATIDATVRGKVLVLEKPSADDPVMRPDPSVVDVIRGATGARIRRGEGGKPTEVEVRFHSLPVNVAFDVAIRVEGKEYPVEGLRDAAAAKGTTGLDRGRCAAIDGTRATRADVVLRASPRAARRTVDLFEIWDGEVVIEGVEIEGGVVGR
jgi:hypothetical protein